MPLRPRPEPSDRRRRQGPPGAARGVTATLGLVSFALTALRWLTATTGLTALLLGTLFWAPVTGLWLAVWVIGLLCTGIGATIQELDTHWRTRRPGLTDPTVVPRARRVKLSGFGYLTVGMLAAWFPPILTGAMLVAVLVDFAAGHHIARAVTA